MKRVLPVLMLAGLALMVSCKKEDEKCETWVYHEIAISKQTPECPSGNQRRLGLKKEFCGDELKKVFKDSLVEYSSNNCYTFYRQFVDKD